MINFQLLTSYIKHLIKSKTRHGVHSPFVYNLVDNVIYDFLHRADYDAIEQMRKNLLSDQRIIEVTDLGAGSHVNNNRKKSIGNLAKNALKPKKLAQLIYRLANEFKPTNIIELGTCLGLTTAYLAKASPKARLISIEGCPNTAGIAIENLKTLGLNKAEILTGNFDAVFPDVLNDVDQLDFVFIDGNHRHKATLDYFTWCLPKVHDGSLLIFDDIYWSSGMEKAWEEIKAHPKVRVTIDLFWIGLVFFRKEQAKEDFIIRI